jgi:hypothetical protein
MGKGLPGGRRQAGSIDYRTEPCSSVLPDRPCTARGVDRRRPCCVRCTRAAARARAPAAAAAPPCTAAPPAHRPQPARRPPAHPAIWPPHPSWGMVSRSAAFGIGLLQSYSSRVCRWGLCRLAPLPLPSSLPAAALSLSCCCAPKESEALEPENAVEGLCR